MTLIETLASFVVLALLAGIFASVIPTATTLGKKTAEKAALVNKDRCIVTGFRRLCAEQSDSADFAAWCDWCTSLWKDTSIAVRREGFDADGNRIVSCVWNTDGDEKKVFSCIKKEEQ